MSTIRIGFVSYNSDAPDSFQFVALSELEASQTITFTDNGVTSSGTFRANEGFLTWQAPASGVTIGTVVTVNIESGRVDVGSLVDVGDVNFSSSGDQLIAFTGSTSQPTFIAAVNNKGSSFQDDATSSNDSSLPPGLTVGLNAVAVNEIDNFKYAGPTTGSLSSIIDALFSADSFEGSESAAQSFDSSFDITDIDVTEPPTPQATPAPNPAPTTAFPTPSVPSDSNSKCTGYSKGPTLSSGSTQIPEANRLAKSGVLRTVAVEGIVVNDLRSFTAQGFYVQALTSHVPTPPSEGEDEDSHAIFVYCEGNCQGSDFKEGDFVRVTATLAVFSETAQMTDADVELISTGSTASVAGCPDLAFEVHIVDFELPMQTSRSLFSFQGMLMHFEHNLVITDLFGLRYGQLGLAKERVINPTMQVGPGTEEYFALEDLQSRSIVVLDDVTGDICPVPQMYFDPSTGLRSGWEVEIDGNAVMTYFGPTQQFFLVPNEVGRTLIPQNFGVSANPREAELASPADDELRLAGLNMLNYFTTLGCGNCRGADNADEFFRQSNKLYAVIKEMDAAVLGLQEVQNFDGEVLERMIDEINDFIGNEIDSYDFISAGQIGSDAIKNSIIYQPAKVQPVGQFETLSFNNPSDKSRPSLAQTFERTDGTGERFTFVSNHLKSKGSGCSEDNGGANALAGEGNCGYARLQHAEQLIDWLESDPTNSGTNNYILVGDFNSYKEERSVALIRSAGYTNLAARDVDASSLYSTSFDGRFGTLDYIFASADMANNCGKTKEWHINSDETVLIDYNDEQYSSPSSCGTKPPSYTDLSVFRSSDHDPIMTHCSFAGSISVEKSQFAITEEHGLFALAFAFAAAAVMLILYSRRKVATQATLATEGDITKYTL